MSIETLKQRLPEYAKDLKLNLSSVLAQPNLNDAQIWGTALVAAIAARNPRVLQSTELSPRQVWGTALAAAIASRNPEVIDAVAADAAAHLTEEEGRAARAAAAIMAMNNIYYRFLYMAGSDEYAKLPARLRMHVIGKPGVDKVDFELWSLAVSAINGCQDCVRAHEREVRGKGLTAAGVQDAVRIAAVIHGVAVTLEGEASSGAASAAA